MDVLDCLDIQRILDVQVPGCPRLKKAVRLGIQRLDTWKNARKVLETLSCRILWNLANFLQDSARFCGILQESVSRPFLTTFRQDNFLDVRFARFGRASPRAFGTYPGLLRNWSCATCLVGRTCETIRS